MVSTHKRMENSLQVEGVSLPQAEESKYLQILMASWSRRWTGVLSAVIKVLHKPCVVNEGAQQKGKVFQLLVHLYFIPDLWSQDLGCDRKNEIPDSSGCN